MSSNEAIRDLLEPQQRDIRIHEDSHVKEPFIHREVSMSCLYEKKS